MLRETFRPNREQVTQEWRRLHNEVLYGLYSSPNIRVIKSGRVRWVGHVACTEENERYIQGFVGNPEVRRPLARPAHKWENNIKMNLQEVGRGGMDWSDLA